MIKKKDFLNTLALFFISSILLSSCSEEYEDMTVNINSTGLLSIKVLGADGNGYAGAEVKIHSENTEGYLFLDSTNTQGVFEAGSLLEKHYRVETSIMADNRIYNEEKLIQVVAGEEHNITSDPYKNSGSASLYFIDGYNDVVMQGVNVALVLESKVDPFDYEHQNVLDNAYFIGETDENGNVSFDNIPSGKLRNINHYMIYLFTDENENMFLNSTTITVRKNRLYSKAFKVFWLQ